MSATDNVPCLPGRRKRRSRFLKRELRNRQFYDVVQIAQFYQRERLLCEHSLTDQRYEELAAAELSVVAATSLHGAKKILNLSGIYHNTELWEFLKKCDGFKVFDETNFTKSYTSLREGGGTFRLDFLDAFINGNDFDFHEKRLQKRRKLDAISLTFTPAARDVCVNMYFRAMSVIPTLCSFMNIYSDLNETFMLDIMERYISPNWYSNERQRQYHSNCYQIFLVDGWNLVNEIFKVQVQELYYWKDAQIRDPFIPDEGSSSGVNTSSANDKDIPKENNANHRITEENLRDKAHLFCQNVIIEFFAWCSTVIKPKDTDDFWGNAVGTIDQIYEKLCTDVGASHTCTELDEENAIKTLRHVSDGHPNMAELRYDAATMTPGRRLAKPSGNWRWIPKDILMRCRWNDSPVASQYAAFLKESEESYHSIEEESGTTVQAETNHVNNETITAPEKNAKATRDITRVKRARERDVDCPEKKRKKSSKQAPAINIAKSKQPNFMYDDEDSGIDDISVGSASHDVGLGLARKVSQVAAETGTPQISDLDPHDEITNNAIQSFYQIIVDWPILKLENSADFNITTPRTTADMKAASNFINGDARWIEFFTKSRRRFIQKDVTNVEELKLYQEHWKNILCIEVRGMISERVSELLPSICSGKLPGFENDWVKDIPQETFLPTRVEKVDPTGGLFNLTCKSTFPSVNRRIADELSGGNICFAYIRSSEEGRKEGRGCTPLLLAICRRVTWDQDDVIQQTSEIYEIELHVVVSRVRVRSRGIWPGESLFIFQVSPFSPYLRMFKSIQESYSIPNETQNVLFGHNCPLPRIYTPRRRVEIDPGSAAYVDALKGLGKLNDSQFRAVCMALANIGDCTRNSSSFSLLQGPPGTGKTSLIPILVGAILSHSKVGHLNHPQVNALKDYIKEDGILRNSTNGLGVKFLICCPSNQAVDNCLDKFLKPGIPDGKGGTLKIEMVRLAKSRHNYGNFANYSIDKRALPFDHFLYHKEDKDRKTASGKAKKAFGRECLVVFCTNSTAGGDKLKSLKSSFDIIIQDEAGQALEPEAIIPATNALKRSLHGRCHQILCGDPRQLPPVSNGLPFVQKVRRWLEFDYKVQIRSLFERLDTNRRAPLQLLDQQYRMHPCIAEMHSEIFYEGRVRSPIPAEKFSTSYNSGWSPHSNSLSPVLLVDTSKLEDRFELNEKNGIIMNSEEINIIDETLDKIKRLSGADFPTLQNEIAVILPYRSQVDFAKRTLESYGKFVLNGTSRQGFRITVNTVDSMQGGERDVVIFAATRSNSLQEVGFLEQPNRLNVAISRARKLLVIIADISTMKACNSFGKFWDYCLKGRNNSALVTFSDPKNSRLATLQLSQEKR